MVLNIEVGMGEPTFLGGKKSVWKVLILLHKQTKRRFHLTVFVHDISFNKDISQARLHCAKENEYQILPLFYYEMLLHTR